MAAAPAPAIVATAAPGSISTAVLAGAPDVADYAAIGNCKTLALVSRFGSIDWLCLPYFSGPSVFAALLDAERGGRFAITGGDMLSAEQSYLPDSNVLRTVLRCRAGTLEIIDCMAITPGDVRQQRELKPAHELLRIVRCIDGAVDVHAVFEPRPDYACRLPQLVPRGRLGWQCTLASTTLHLLSSLPFEATGPATLGARVQLRRGEQREASLGCNENEISVIQPLGPALQARVDAAHDWWRTWCNRCTFEGPYRDAVRRSALALKLLSYSVSGAVIAAGTTSLPEGTRGERNWDYRFCWLRDTSLVLQSFMDLGHEEESSAFLGWLLHATRLTRPRLQVVYDVYGRSSLREREVPQLRGHRGIGPVRVGNAASQQEQLDVYGEVLLTAHEFVRRGGILDREEKALVAGFATTAAALWRNPDQSIWEIRLPPRHNTYSKLMCWAAIDCALALHERIGLPLDAAELARQRAALREDIDRHGYDPAVRSYVGSYGGSDADASLLQIARLGYLQPGDPRLEGTLRYIEQQLAAGALTYRYRPGPRYDGVLGSDNPFIICSFWRVECLARLGHVDEARALFEQLLALRTATGLFAEEADPRDGAPCGNFPQAFSHTGLIAAALALADAEART
ncbi:MAG TPA: glycoside hydrolase family 15 protein [Burkholderiaceae bacterium]|nr:glycoside hydrolase family 15 protein [Burkholderiaceae bacterium]